MSATQRLVQVALLLVVLSLVWLRADRPAWGQELNAAERARLEKEAAGLTAKGVALDRQGNYDEAIRLLRNALALRRRLYPATQFPDGHPALAQSLSWLGFLLQVRGELAEAEPLYREALALYRKLHPEAQFPGGHPDLARSL